MERFLPAVQAAAVSSLQWAARKHSRPAKQVEVEEGLSYRPYVPSPYMYRPNFVSQGPEQDTNNDDRDNDYAETDNLRKKVCGLLPRFCLMNPLPGMKVRRSLPPPPPPGKRTISPQTISSHESVGQAEDEQVPTLKNYKRKVSHLQAQQSSPKHGRTKGSPSTFPDAIVPVDVHTKSLTPVFHRKQTL